jgi:hypothetical protein
VGAKRDDLAHGVHAGVGASGRGYLDRRSEKSRERRFQRSCDRAKFGLKLKARKIRAVVLDDGTVRCLRQ